MMKHILIALLFLSTSLSSLAVKKAEASEFDKTFITHEQFVMMSLEDRRAVVIQMMEFIVSMEGQSKFREVVKQGTPEEKAKWKRIVKIISELFISSAQAQDQFQSYSKNFMSTLNANDVGVGVRCIYGGWISQVSGVDNICAHPSKVKNKKGKNLVHYAEKCPTKPGGLQQITCNPVIFGFEKGSQPFCANAHPSVHNSSLECMKKSLSAPNKEARLDAIAENLAKNPEVFHSVMEFLFYSCACDPELEGKNIAINKSYHNYMRPHRTCYGLLNQMKTVLNRNKCDPLKADENFEVMVDFLNGIQNKVGSYDLEANANVIAKNTKIGQNKLDQFDKEFGKAIDEAYSKDPKTQAFCKAYIDSAPGKTPEEVTTPKPVAGGDNNDKAKCTIVCEEKIKKAVSVGGKSSVQADGATVKAKEEKAQSQESEEHLEASSSEKTYDCKKIIHTPGKTEPEEIALTQIIKSNDDLKEIKHGELICEGSLPEEDEQDLAAEKKTLKATLTSNIGPTQATFTISVKDEAGEDQIVEATIDWKKSAAEGAGKSEASLGATPTLTQPRGTTEYEVCAELKVKDEANYKLEGEGKLCGKVPPQEIKAQPQQPQGQQGTGMPQRMPRQQNIHINWGVR